MADRVDPAKIEEAVGARRDPSDHLGRAVSAEAQVYVLHSEACLASGIDLLECEYTQALERGIDLDMWDEHQDVPVKLFIDPDWLDLVPTAPALQDSETGEQ